MTDTPASPDIFTRISDSSEKARLFRDLVLARGELFAKRLEPSADTFVLMTTLYHNGQIHCKVIGSTSHLSSSGELVLTCFVGGEKYFFQTHYECLGDIVHLKTPEDLFHLQRREDYRIRIPSRYKVLLEVVSINDQTKKS